MRKDAVSGLHLSVVTTLYRSAPYLDEFHRRMSHEARAISDRYEIIYVHDGSPDDSLARALEIQKSDEHVIVLDLSRNFGHHRAVMTGLEYARGDYTFLIDSDLEEEPELLRGFYATMSRRECDVVFGVQRARKGGWFERVSGQIFYTVFNALSAIKLPRNLMMARLMTHRYVAALLRFTEREVFLAGIWSAAGFTQVPFETDKISKGATSYSLSRKIALATTSLLSFSDRPLVMIFYAGLLISALASLAIAYLVTAKVVFGIPIDGWTSLIVSIWFLGGLTILFLGIIGVYLSKVYLEVKRRPLAIVRQVYGRGADEG
jgi:putative glycosyltransferase